MVSAAGILASWAARGAFGRAGYGLEIPVRSQLHG